MRTLIEFRYVSALSLAALLTLPALGQDKKPAEKKDDKPAAAKPDDKKGAKPDDKKPAGGMPSDEDMAKMMALAQPNDNHKMLVDNMVGNWTYTIKTYMDPSGKPQESKGTATVKSVLGGRYCEGEYKGKMEMPGADGKMTSMDFEGHGIDGYDNVKQKFVSVWYDNMGTGFMTSEGTWDAASKSYTFHGEYEPMPGMKEKVKMVINVPDKDHHSMVWYEDQGGKENKTMEISYTRKS